MRDLIELARSIPGYPFPSIHPGLGFPSDRHKYQIKFDCYRLGDYQAYYHQEFMEGLVKITRMLLHHKYPRYLEDGGMYTSEFHLPYEYNKINHGLQSSMYSIQFTYLFFLSR